MNYEQGKQVSTEQMLTWASRHKLIVAIGEWHHEAYKDINKSLPEGFTKDCLSRKRSSANSDEVSKIKLRA